MVKIAPDHVKLRRTSRGSERSRLSDLWAVRPAVAINTDEITIHKQGRVSAERTIRTVGLELGIGNIYVFIGIVFKQWMRYGNPFR